MFVFTNLFTQRKRYASQVFGDSEVTFLKERYDLALAPFSILLIYNFA